MITAPISVVIPAYNCEAFIGGAIKSVLAQTLPVAEVIVVDDGSSDRTGIIAESLVGPILRQPNGGVAAARNAGIRASSQPWIAFLDQDDLWEPDKIRRQWEAAQICAGAGIVSCDFCLFEGERLLVPSFLRRSDIKYEQAEKIHLRHDISYFPQLGRDFFFLGSILFPSAVMVCRDLLFSAGLFNSKFDGIEDCDCFFRVLTRTSLAIVEQPLMHYRLHEHNAGNDSLKMLLNLIAFIDEMIAHAELYPKEAPKAWSRDLWDHLTGAGRLLLGEGKSTDARALLSRSLKQRFSFRTFSLLCASCCGPGVFKSLLAAKQVMEGKYYRRVVSSSQLSR